jgi:hypothetical protein
MPSLDFDLRFGRGEVCLDVHGSQETVQKLEWPSLYLVREVIYSYIDLKFWSYQIPSRKSSLDEIHQRGSLDLPEGSIDLEVWLFLEGNLALKGRAQRLVPEAVAKSWQAVSRAVDKMEDHEKLSAPEYEELLAGVGCGLLAPTAA